MSDSMDKDLIRSFIISGQVQGVFLETVLKRLQESLTLLVQPLINWMARLKSLQKEIVNH